MEDSLLNKAALQSHAVALGKLLGDHRGNEVIVMDMGPLDYWTDFFVIATVTSDTHLGGLQRHIKDFAIENDLEILHRSRKPNKDDRQGFDEWCLMDLGGIVVHLMSDKTRSFYELERLWSAAPVIYSSKSS